MGDILDIVREDARDIVTAGGFETPLILTSPDALTTIETNGIAIRRTDHLVYDNGDEKNTPFASITVPFDIFDFTGKVISLKDWKVQFTDSQDTVTYTITDILPNRTIGIINCTLKYE